MSDMKQELEALFMHFIHVEDASFEMNSVRPLDELEGRWWGWIVHDDASALQMGYRPSFGVEYQGVKSTEKDAVDAAVGYIWLCRPDLVAQCKKEAAAGRAYRKQVAEGGSGMAIQ